MAVGVICPPVDVAGMTVAGESVAGAADNDAAGRLVVAHAVPLMRMLTLIRKEVNSDRCISGNLSAPPLYGVTGRSDSPMARSSSRLSGS